MADEENIDIILNSALAAARIGDVPTKRTAFGRLVSLDFTVLSENQQVDLIRAHSLLFLRSDLTQDDRDLVADQLSDQYPSESKVVNWELVQILSNLNDPLVVARTMNLINSESLDGSPSELIEADVAGRSAELQGQYGDVIERMKINSPNSVLIHYVQALSHVNKGWTQDLREDYFRHFARLLSANGGASYHGFIIKIRDDALIQTPGELRGGLKNISGEELQYVNAVDLANLPQPKGPGKDWQMKELTALLESSQEESDNENGAIMYQAALCAACHAFGGSGGNIGPDLTQISTRFSTDDLLEALVDPDKTISDQYSATEIDLKDGTLLWGRVIRENQDTLFLTQNPMQLDRITKIPKVTVEDTRHSDRSIMFPALLNRLNAEEVKDLIFYLQSGGGKANSGF